MLSYPALRKWSIAMLRKWPCSGSVAGTDLGGVLAEGDVAHVVESVLDAPVASYDQCQALRGSCAEVRLVIT
jgi:hypothetical protein